MRLSVETGDEIHCRPDRPHTSETESSDLLAVPLMEPTDDAAERESRGVSWVQRKYEHSALHAG